MSEENKEIKKRKTSFQNWDKAIEDIYKDERSLNRLMGESGSNRRVFDIRTKAQLQEELSRALDNNQSIAEISKTLHGIDSNYMKIIAYLSQMFHIRYTVTPVAAEITKYNELSSEEYLEKYNEMINVVDGINMETLIPQILQEIFLSGIAYLYAEKNNPSKTVVVTLLPAGFCRTVLKTNYGTNVIEFDFNYFTSFVGDDLETILDYFPKEFRKLHQEFLTDQNESWKMLNPKFSTSILANEKGIPPFISALKGINEYDDVRGYELEKSENQLKKILIHQIPVVDGEPIFDLSEVKSIQLAMNKVTRRHQGLDTITSFGDTQLHSLQEEGKTENKRITQAYETIFNAAGLNASLFAGKTDLSLKLSQSVDKSMVWGLIKEFNSFINLAINNLYKFKPLQTEIKLLPITLYDELETVKVFRENAAFGLGKLDAVVASGVKQKNLAAQNRLEEELNLDKLLKPLQSSYTQSGKETTNGAEGTTTINEITSSAEGDEEVDTNE